MSYERRLVWISLSAGKGTVSLLPGRSAVWGMFMRKTYLALFSLICAPVVIMSGCVANRYEAPAASFRDKTQQTVNILSSYYASRNSYEVHLYLQSVAADSQLPLETTDRNGAPTPLGKPVFSPASIKARLDALSLVGVYANRLYDLANSSAPPNLKAGLPRWDRI